MFRRTRNEETTQTFSNAIQAEPTESEPQALSLAGTILGFLVAVLSFVGMMWWFFSFATLESPAAFWIAGISAAVVIVSVVSRTLKHAEGHDHVYALATWFGLLGTVAFAILGLLIPPSLGQGLDPGEDPSSMLLQAAAAAFFVGGLSTNTALAVLLAAHWPRRAS